ncbi:MAG: hypothetical protein NE330_02330 [Lentisphaeraceae bacterium]|nr:hypothetical protein [Lentisphaeraceae bacterium]
MKTIIFSSVFLIFLSYQIGFMRGENNIKQKTFLEESLIIQNTLNELNLTRLKVQEQSNGQAYIYGETSEEELEALKSKLIEKFTEYTVNIATRSIKEVTEEHKSHFPD